jgi:hypothetical protein
VVHGLVLSFLCGVPLVRFLVFSRVCKPVLYDVIHYTSLTCISRMRRSTSACRPRAGDARPSRSICSIDEVLGAVGGAEAPGTARPASRRRPRRHPRRPRAGHAGARPCARTTRSGRPRARQGAAARRPLRTKPPRQTLPAARRRQRPASSCAPSAPLIALNSSAAARARAYRSAR